jgi:hypothetical protein
VRVGTGPSRCCPPSVEIGRFSAKEIVVKHRNGVRFEIRRLATCAVVAATTATALVSSAAPATAGAAVFKDEDVGCFLDPGDIPGMPGFGLPEATLVLRADGGVTLSCHGWLPDQLSLPRTFAGSAPCFGPGGVVTAHVVATKSGRVHFICHFPKET